MAAYVIVFELIYGWAGDQTGALAFAPALAGGFLLGRRRAAAFGVLVALVNGMLYASVYPGVGLIGHLQQGIVANVAVVAATILAGSTADLMRNVRHQRQQAQERAIQLYETIQQKQELVEGLDLFRKIVDRSTDALLCVDARTGRFRDVNETACSSLGFTRQELLATGVEAIADPEDHAFSWETHVALLREKGAALFEGRMMHKDGGFHWAEINATLLTVGDQELVVASARDITHRRLQEKALEESRSRQERIIGSIQDNVYELRRSMSGAIVCTYTSGRVRDLTGFGPESFVSGETSWFSLVHPGDVELVRQHIQFLDARHGHHTATYRVFNVARNEYLWVEDCAMAEGHVDGELLILGVCREITTRVQRERARLEAVEREAELERLRSEARFKTNFLNTAAHELNTPLTPLILQLELLKSHRLGSLTSIQSNAVTVIERNISRLASLVKDMLEAARLEQGKLRLALASTDLAGLARATLDSYDAQARANGIRMSLSGNPRIVEADARRIEHVLSNLVSNALKFTPRGGQIQVLLEDRLDAVYIEVRDSGRGLEQEQIDRLFQPFSQVHDTSKMTIGGTGLGLYICKGIIAEHGGTIGCDSGGQGEGARFWFTIPTAPAARGAEAAIAPEMEAVRHG